MKSKITICWGLNMDCRANLCISHPKEDNNKQKRNKDRKITKEMTKKKNEREYCETRFKNYYCYLLLILIAKELLLLIRIAENRRRV